jgi:S-adenosylmethionine decarboxylase
MEQLNALGKHIIAELFQCQNDILDDLEAIKIMMISAAITAGAKVEEVSFHRFTPQGISGVVIISESHLTIHTWPELGYAAVDIFTCGEDTRPWDAYAYIVEKLRPLNTPVFEIKRGIITKGE